MGDMDCNQWWSYKLKFSFFFLEIVLKFSQFENFAWLEEGVCESMR
jgi:hypothetical protein